MVGGRHQYRCRGPQKVPSLDTCGWALAVLSTEGCSGGQDRLCGSRGKDHSNTQDRADMSMTGEVSWVIGCTVIASGRRVLGSSARVHKQPASRSDFQSTPTCEGRSVGTGVRAGGLRQLERHWQYFSVLQGGCFHVVPN